jgi:hypothetical protein
LDIRASSGGLTTRPRREEGDDDDSDANAETKMMFMMTRTTTIIMMMMVLMLTMMPQVLPDKVAMIRDYFGRAVKRWGIPLLGVIPDEPYLGKPTLRDFEKLLKANLIAGTNFR